MNAAQIEKLREQRKHVENKRHHTDPQCWCALCHCDKCQAARQRGPTDTERSGDD